MNKALLLRLHRWVALIFGLPLLAIVLTGLVLSFEPIVVQSAMKPGSVTVQAVEGLLQRYDPQGSARALFLRPHENTLTISSGRPGGGAEIDLSTGQPVTQDATTLSDIFGLSRQIHEHLLLRAGWLVTASTIAMLVLIVIGILMGVPKLRNTPAGWHKGVAWFLLPLVALSPLTGLLLALGVTFTSASPAARPSGPPLPLLEAVRVLGTDHDVSTLTWIRPLGENLVARIAVDGELKTYTLTRDGAAPGARMWPRLIHEGTWGGLALSILNLVTSIALLGLLVTGVWIWAHRKLRRGPSRQRLARGALAR
ncbi:PepSY-associated TM helix domain-containing protein [Microvirga sp. G4-2]|uniref:PepSY-associated TM helix domain-containing protein n=1 Tax=Microvirga sp. G4-2 TaxID=3434467 RepID=UPI0040440F52